MLSLSIMVSMDPMMTYLLPIMDLIIPIMAFLRSHVEKFPENFDDYDGL